MALMNQGVLALFCACLQLLFAAGGELYASPVSESDSSIFVYRNLVAATAAGETGCKSCEDGPPIDLSLNKEVDNATPNIGDDITYTLTLANKGGSQRKATWITVVDTPPSGLTFVSAIEPGGTSFNPATMTWSVPELNKGDSITLKITFSVDESGTWKNVAEVTAADEHDIDSTPGNASQTSEDDDDFVTIEVPDIEVPALEPMCYLVADNDGFLNSDDAITFIDDSFVEASIGMAGTRHTEAIAFDPGTGILYGANADRFGSIDLSTGVFSEIGPFGSGNGAFGVINFADVDGLSFDPFSGIMYASVRRSGIDKLIQVDLSTGSAVTDAFGPGLTYVPIPAINNLDDIDDIAVSSVDGTLYAIMNENGKMSRLITIDKSTGASTDVTDLDVENVEGLGFHPDGRFLGVLGNGGRKVVEIDPLSGTTTVLSNLGVNGFRDYEGIACLTEPQNAIQGTVFLKKRIDLELEKSATDPDGSNNVTYTLSLAYNSSTHPTGPNPSAGIATAGITVELYADVNTDGTVDGADTFLASTVTAGDGTFLFEISALGSFVLQVDLSSVPDLARLPADNVETAVFVGFGETDVGNDFYFHTFTDATGISVRDIIPPGVIFTGASAVQGSYDNTTGIWTIGSIPIAGGTNLTIDVTQTELAVENCAEINYADQKDLDSTPDNGNPDEDDYDCAPTEIQPPALGSIGDFVFEDLDGDGVADSGEPGLPGVTIHLYNGVCGPDGSSIEVRVSNSTGAYLFSDLEPGSYCVDPVESTVPFGFQLTTANDPMTVSLGPGEPFLDADFGYVSNPDAFEADLELSKTVSSSSPAQNDIVTFTITLSNRGPAEATNVIVRDVIPAGLVYIDATPSQGYYDTQNGFWGVGTLPNDASVELKIRVQVVIQNMIENIAQVIAVDQHDPDSTPGNGKASEDDQDNAIIEARGPGSSGDILRVECADVGTINALAYDPARDVLLAGSEGGRIHVSTDSGANWPHFLETANSTPVRDILIAASGNAYAGTFGDGAYVSSDGGTTWFGIGPASAMLNDIDVDNATETIYAAGQGRVVAYDGVSWAEIGAATNPFGTRQVIAVLFYSATGAVYASTDDQGVYRFDGGVWSAITSGLPVGKVNALLTGPNNELLAGTNNDGVYIFSGADWSPFGSGLQGEPIESLGTGPNGELLAGARESAAYYYNFVTGTWISIGNLPIFTVTSITAGALGEVYAGAPGEGIYVIFDTDFDGIPDMSHQIANYLTTAVVQDLVVTPTGELFAATYGYGVLYSNDGGKCWVRMNRGLENLWVFAIARRSDGTLFIGIWADSKGGIWRSNDDGRNWEFVAFPDRQIISLAIDPTDEDVMYAGVNLSGTGSIYKTTDGGHTWTVLDSFTQPVWSITISPFNTNRILVGTLGDGVWQSLDGGTSFEQIGSPSNGLDNDAVFELVFAPPGSPYAGEPFAGTGAGVYQYDSLADSWSLVGTGSEQHEVRVLEFLGPHIFAGTWSAGVIKYNPATDIWEDFALPYIPVIAFAAHPETETLVIGTSGQGIFLSPNMAFATGVQDGPGYSDVPSLFHLEQNYPNPFNPQTTIPFRVQASGRVRIAVYDILGRELDVLVDRLVSPGRYEVSWQAFQRPSGTYIVRMESAGSVNARTISLLK